MEPSQANQFDITKSFHAAELHRAGFSTLLTQSVAEALGTELSLRDLTKVCVSVVCKLGFNEPLYLFEVDVAGDAETLRPSIHGLSLKLRENAMDFSHRAALWRAAPSLAPGGAANRGDHTPVETSEDLIVQRHVPGSMPSGHRPLLIRFLPPPSDVIARPFALTEFLSMSQKLAGDFSLATSSRNLPWELQEALALIPAPAQSSVVGSALDYVQTFVQSVVFTTSLSALDWAGCWHAVGSAAHVFGVDSGKSHLGRAAVVSLIEPVSGEGDPARETANTDTLHSVRQLPPARTRSVAEILDLLINAAAKQELFVRSGLSPAKMRAIEVVPLEHFATKRQLEAVIALDCKFKQNERPSVLQTVPWRDETIVAARRTKLEERLSALQERLGDGSDSYPKF